MSRFQIGTSREGVVLYQNKYRIEPARLENWIYSLSGYYYVTLCTKNREYYFGHIAEGKMILSDIGKMAEKYWKEIPVHFPFVSLDEFIIMPNHIHGIVILEKDAMECGDAINLGDAINRVSTGGVTKQNNPMLNQAGISYIVRWYKGRVAYEIKKSRLSPSFGWQPRFYDHVIRSEEDFIRIQEYIRLNPLNWDTDEENMHL